MDHEQPFSNEPVFAEDERETLSAHPSLSAFRNITRAQLAGLLSALGEYAWRNLSGRFPEGLRDSELIVANKAMIAFARELHLAADSPRVADDQDLEFSPLEDAIFDAEERRYLARDKYVGGHEGITRRQLHSLLQALATYSRRAPLMQDTPDYVGGPARALHAHNALVTFRERPFTFEEFRESVWEVLEESSRRLAESAAPAEPRETER